VLTSVDLNARDLKIIKVSRVTVFNRLDGVGVMCDEDTCMLMRTKRVL